MPEQVGLDTSIVVRLLVGEPEKQTEAATKLVKEAAARDSPCWVSDWVVAESYFVLTHHYGIDRDAALEQLLRFLCSGAVMHTGFASEALTATRTGTPGLMDHLVRKDYLQHCDKVYTFDKAFARLEGIELLKGTDG